MPHDELKFILDNYHTQVVALGKFTEGMDEWLKKRDEYMTQAHTAITKYFEGLVPEEESVPPREDDPAIYSWSRGHNACRTKILRRIREEK